MEHHPEIFEAILKRQIALKTLNRADPALFMAGGALVSVRASVPSEITLTAAEAEFNDLLNAVKIETPSLAKQSQDAVMKSISIIKSDPSNIKIFDKAFSNGTDPLSIIEAELPHEIFKEVTDLIMNAVTDLAEKVEAQVGNVGGAVGGLASQAKKPGVPGNTAGATGGDTAGATGGDTAGATGGDIDTSGGDIGGGGGGDMLGAGVMGGGGGGAVAVGSQLKEITDQLSGVGKTVVEGVNSAADTIKSGFGDASEQLSGVGKTVGGAVSSVADTVKSSGVGNAVSSVADTVKSSGVGGAVSSVADTVKSSGFLNAFSSAASAVSGSDVGGVVMGAVASVGGVASEVLNNVSSDDLENIAMIALNLIGTASAALPFLAPLQIALKDLGSAVKMAKFNREAARMLTQRCADCSVIAAELAPKISKVSKDPNEQKMMLQGLVDAVNECGVYLNKFTKKGFIMHIMGSTKDQHELSILDKRVTDSIQNLSLRLDGKQLDAQAANTEKLDEILMMIHGKMGGSNDTSTVTPDMIADIAKQAGCASAEAISDELQCFGLKLEEISADLLRSIGIMERVDAKIDLTNNKLDNVSDMIQSNALAQEERDKGLQTALLDFTSDSAARETKTLNLIKEIAAMQGVNMTPVFSTKQQTLKLATRAKDLKAQGFDVIMIHPNGIDESKQVKIDGEHGAAGDAGKSGNHGKSGFNGGPGSPDGHDGEDAPDFEVTIEFLSEDIVDDKVIHNFRIEHAGTDGKVEEIVKVDIKKAVFLINGKGGTGGNGGHGGNGIKTGNHQPGGHGGSGGTGGRGASGGTGGEGGNGANGARVVVHTNYPELFTLMETDVSGGEVGLNGRNGTAGSGGATGNGGAGGEGDACPAGKGGKKGKEGKGGKASKMLKKGKTMKDGECGTVSFCLYDDDGSMSTAGAPYRIVLTKADVDKLTPVSMVATKECKDEPLYFGETVLFGPVLPLNTGSLYAPPSKLYPTLLASPRIPAEEKTKYGTLTALFARQIKVKIPRISSTGFSVTNNAWPWDQKASPLIAFKAKYHIQFEVGKYIQRASDDGKHTCQKDYEVSVEAPIDFTIDTATGTACLAPTGIECNSDAPYKISFFVQNKIKGNAIDVSGYTYRFWIAGERFCPKLFTASSSTIDTSHAPSTYRNKPLFLTSAAGDVPKLTASDKKEVEFCVTIPSPTVVPSGQEIRPGSFIHTRCELFCDGQLFQYSAPTSIRLIAPRPPTGMDGRPTDVLVFCSYQQSPEDYLAIEQITAFLRLRVFFLDYSHFKDQKSGILAADYWSGLHGKAVVVWAPANTGQESIVTAERLMSHLQADGGLICADASAFGLSTEMSGELALKSKEARRLIYAPQDMSLTLLKTDMKIENITLPAPVSKSVPQLTGKNAKIAFIQSHIKDIGEESLAIGNAMLDVFYDAPVEAGCCGCGGAKRIVPMSRSQSPCTVIDVVLSAMKTDLLVDLVSYDKYQNMSFCPSINTLFQVSEQCNSNDRVSILTAFYMAGLFTASNISSKKIFKNSTPFKAWEKDQRYEATTAMNVCISICESNNLGFESLAMRIKAADVIKGCIPLNTINNVTDLSGGSCLHTMMKK
eukprot:gene7895-16162_t